MLSPQARAQSLELPAQAPVCEMVRRNSARLILDAAGDSLLAGIAADFDTLMGTCFSVHEANGDLAYSVLVSDWCRYLDASAIRHCASTGVCEPRACARWLCHQSRSEERRVGKECRSRWSP